MYLQQYIYLIEKTWENRELLQQQEAKDAIHAVVEALDKGRLRVA
jgi:2,3,4,5-tetrahydropyridine-2-carboxylate N-succinyltransferase